MRFFKTKFPKNEKNLKFPCFKKTFSVLLTIAIALVLAGCSGNDKSTPDVSSSEDSEYQSGFDIERARKNIVIKGHPFEMPMTLKDLKDGWTWEEDTKLYAGEGRKIVYLYYNGEEMLSVPVKNYYSGHEEEGYIYNLAIVDGEGSIDGFTPTISTKQDFLDKYGEPVSIKNGLVTYDEAYSYGIKNEDGDAYCDGQYISALFLDDGTLSGISITYTGSTKND